MSRNSFQLVLFDDEIARRWDPFALTRPAGELIFGAMTLRRRMERVFGAQCVGYLAAPHLEGFDEAGAPPVISASHPPRDQPRLFLLSRFVPAFAHRSGWRADTDALEAGPVTTTGGDIVGWFSPPGTSGPSQDFLAQPASAPGSRNPPVTGRTLTNVWDLICGNPDQIALDIEALFLDRNPSRIPDGAFHWGNHPVIVDPSATIEPGSAFDTTAGPIWIDEGAHVRAFTRLAGPAYIGPRSALLGGAIEAVSLGPVCRIRGELAESVCLGYVNKQHDGHIGHAYLGRWVNLGAETTNSDLKNNYGTIRLWTPTGETDTGETKLGSLLGDHVKTGIGLLLNTGTVIGAGTNLFGTSMPPTYVAPFRWGTGEETVEYRLDKFLEVAAKAMARRGVETSQSAIEQLSRAWNRARERAGT